MSWPSFRKWKRVLLCVYEDQDHLPQFKCTVTENGARYDSPSAFNHTQNAGAEAAVENLLKRGLLSFD
jgi:hypothetical protein